METPSGVGKAKELISWGSEQCTPITAAEHEEGRMGGWVRRGGGRRSGPPFLPTGEMPYIDRSG